MADSNQTLKDELRQERREKEWAESWRPDEPGDMLIGTLEGYDEATTDYGSYHVAHVRNEEGVLKGLWLMHSVLQDEWEEASPEIGDRVGAMYHGQRDGEQYSYHMWSVRVDRTEANGREESTQEPTGNDRSPQKPGSGGAPDFDGSDLYGEPATETEATSEDAGGESRSEAGSGESTLDDPNGSLPF